MTLRIDCEQLKAQLCLKDKAIQQGAQNLPATTDTVLDAAQESIIAKVQNLHTEVLQETELALASQRLKRQEITSSIHETHLISEFEGIAAHAQRQLVEIEAEDGGYLRELRKEELRMQRQYNAFRARNQLTERQAHYPASQWKHWAIIATAVLIESAINSYFYKEATDSGYAGGVFVAFLIAVVNVVFLAYPIGAWVLPQFHHVKPWPRAYLAFIGGLIVMVGIVLVNLAAAHTRAIISNNQNANIPSQEAFSQAISKLKTHAFAVDNFEAWILFSLGLGIAAYAISKGYKSDDPYPGFGEQERLLRRAKGAYNHEKEAYTQKVIVTLKTVERGMDSRILSIRQAVSQYQSSLEASAQIKFDYERSLSEHNKCVNALLRYYREVNESVRTGSSPAYYSHVNVIQSAALTDINAEERQKGQYFADLLIRLESVVESTRRALDTIREQYLSRLTELHQRWQVQALNELGEENTR